MPAFTFTSKSKYSLFALILVSTLGLSQANALGNDDATQKSDEPDFTNSPFTEYGEFDQEKEEAADARFFQFGRFFGVSLGTGYEGVAGNRGQLWQGGSPAIDFKVHYWFDFNFALDLGIFSASHYYDTDKPQSDHVDLSLLRIGFDLKYYVETQDLGSAITFANPYFLVGAGSFSKSETSQAANSTDTDSSFGFSAGMGFEFPIRPKRVYFALEGKASFVTFKDSYTQRFSPNLEDLTGFFYSITGGLLFTW